MNYCSDWDEGSGRTQLTLHSLHLPGIFAMSALQTTPEEDDWLGECVSMERLESSTRS